MRQASCCHALAATILVLTLCPAPASGAPSRSSAAERAANEQAIALYRQSTRAYDEGRFQDAADLLTRAYALHAEPILLFNLARAYEGSGNVDKAIDAYTRYLAREPGAPDRRSIEQRVATLQKQVDDRQALERQRDEERARVEQAHRDAERARQAAERAEEQRRRPSVVPWVVAGAGVAGIGAGVVLGVVSHAHYVDARDEPFKAPASADYSSAQSFATGANVAFVAGGVVAAAGLVWGLVDVLGKRGHEAPGVGFTGNGIAGCF
jgi:tetratricopeptide (TPR) repeat protein